MLGVLRDAQWGQIRRQGGTERGEQETGCQGCHHEHPGLPALGDQGPKEKDREDCADDQRGAVSPGERLQPPGQMPAEGGHHHVVPVEGEYEAG
jgi:hypothetical protein